MTDIMDLLAQADPARDLDPPPPEDLLAALIATPRARRPRIRPRGLVLGGVAAGVAAIAVVLATFADHPPALDLAARAYAQTGDTSNQILHVVATATSTVVDASGSHLRESMIIEDWHRGRETHHLERYLAPGGDQTAALDHVIGDDGVMRQLDEAGHLRVIKPSDNADAATVIGAQQSGFVADFRARYSRGQLDDGGDVTFAGRPARRYVVSPDAQVGPEGMRPTQAFYVDRDTGEPLGYTSTVPYAMPGPRGGTPGPGRTEFVETVRTLERLAPTPGNVAKLETFALARAAGAGG